MDLGTALWLIARKHPHGLGKFRLLKLLWLAELRHMQRHGSRLTDAGWYRWDYGPYSKEVVNKPQDDRDHFDYMEEDTPKGNAQHTIRTHGEDPPVPLTKDDADALKTIADILWEYQEYTNDELKDEVYEDPFFKDSAYSHDFDFDKLAEYNVNFTEAEIEKILAEAA